MQVNHPVQTVNEYLHVKSHLFSQAYRPGFYLDEDPDSVVAIELRPDGPNGSIHMTTYKVSVVDNLGRYFSEYFRSESSGFQPGHDFLDKKDAVEKIQKWGYKGFICWIRLNGELPWDRSDWKRTEIPPERWAFHKR